MKTNFLITGLVLLIIATTLMAMTVAPGYLNSEAFMNYASATAPEPIGAFDGVRIRASPESYWRKGSDVKPLPAFEPGPDNLFIFKDNECKPECCGASYSCGSGCVCTTPDQRKYILSRGGNNTSPQDVV